MGGTVVCAGDRTVAFRLWDRRDGNVTLRLCARGDEVVLTQDVGSGTREAVISDVGHLMR